MLIYGEFETFARISECFGLFINGGFLAMEFILWIFCLFWCATEVGARCSVEVWLSLLGIVLKILIQFCWTSASVSATRGVPILCCPSWEGMSWPS